MGEGGWVQSSERWGGRAMCGYTSWKYVLEGPRRGPGEWGIADDATATRAGSKSTASEPASKAMDDMRYRRCHGCWLRSVFFFLSWREGPQMC